MDNALISTSRTKTICIKTLLDTHKTAKTKCRLLSPHIFHSLCIWAIINHTWRFRSAKRLFLSSSCRVKLSI